MSVDDNPDTNKQYVADEVRAKCVLTKEKPTTIGSINDDEGTQLQLITEVEDHMANSEDNDVCQPMVETSSVMDDKDKDVYAMDIIHAGISNAADTPPIAVAASNDSVTPVTSRSPISPVTIAHPTTTTQSTSAVPTPLATSPSPSVGPVSLPAPLAGAPVPLTPTVPDGVGQDDGSEGTPMEVEEAKDKDQEKKGKGSCIAAATKKLAALPESLKPYQEQFEKLKYGDEWEHLIQGWLGLEKALGFPDQMVSSITS